MDRRKVYIVGFDRAVEEMFVGMGWETTSDLSEADLVQFTGGEDVNPALYGEHPHRTTHFNATRDAYEQEKYFQALEQGIPMAGICRGGQFLNVMNGGTLYQDVDGHALGGTHKAWIEGNLIPVEVTSTHHQMMKANLHVPYEVLMMAGESTARHFMSAITMSKWPVRNQPSPGKNTDVEALFYPRSNCLCFQPHPEYKQASARETHEIYFMFLDRYIFAQEQDDNFDKTADGLPF